jgi:hypothetical protein
MGGKAAKQPGHAEAPQGADNNSRLAFLESRVPLLIGAATGVVARFAPDLELAPKDENEDLVDVQIRLLEEVATCETPCERRIAELEAEAEKAGKPDDAAIAAIARAETAEKRVAELEGEVEELETDLEEMTGLRNAAVNELNALNEGAPPAPPPVEEDAEPEPPEPRERPEAARDVGPTFGNASAPELAEILTSGVEDLEIAFSNGEYEIVEFGPNAIGAGDVVFRGNQYHVEPPLYVKGAPQSEAIAGAALLAGGTQVAYKAFDPPIAVEPGSEHKLHRAIVFG